MCLGTKNGHTSPLPEVENAVVMTTVAVPTVVPIMIILMMTQLLEKVGVCGVVCWEVGAGWGLLG